MLAPDGAVGQVWAVTRPLAYRALAQLEELGYLEVIGEAPSTTGPTRRQLRATAAGRRALAAWLAEPVTHPRDVRSLLLIKLALLDRSGADAAPLLARQRAVMVERIADLEQRAAAVDGFEATVVAWRVAFARSVVAFVDDLAPGTCR